MKGRKPTPTALKILKGNPGRRPLPKNEPMPTPKVPPRPGHLSKEAKAFWRREAKKLQRVGLLTDVDGVAMALLSDAFDRWAKAYGHCEREGEIIYTKGGDEEKGYPIQNPWMAVRNRAWADLLKICAEFGMTPSSRGRVSVAPKGKPTTTRERLFGKEA